jgi:hypothetical protein
MRCENYSATVLFLKQFTQVVQRLCLACLEGATSGEDQSLGVRLDTGGAGGQ